MTNKIQIKVIVTGRVQGVFYRASTKDEADRLCIKGYVKNIPDTSVEAVFEGDRPVVARMIEWCHKGPAGARVDRVRTEEADTISDYKTFEIRY